MNPSTTRACRQDDNDGDDGDFDSNYDSIDQKESIPLVCLSACSAAVLSAYLSNWQHRFSRSPMLLCES